MVAVAMMWSIAGVVTRHLEQARSFEVSFWRSFFTAVVLLIALPLQQGTAVFSKIRQARRTLWLSAICWCFMFTGFMLAMTLTTVANVLITLALGPLFTALLARMLIGHRIALRTWLAIGAAGAGIVWMYADQVAHGLSMQGSLVALCVPIAGALNWTLTQHSQAQSAEQGRIDMVPAVLLGAMLSALLTLPLAYPFQASLHDVGLLAFLGVVQLAIPCVLAVLCARVLQAPEVSLLALLEVVFGIALAWLGAGEKPGLQVLLGGAVVVGALAANETWAWKERQ